jgi:hypothetical protein
MSNYIRQDQADIRVSVDGVAFGDGNSWVTLTGGRITAPGAKTRPGGMGREVEVGGPSTRSNAVLTTQNSDVMAGQHPTLESKVGRGQARVSIQFLDNYGAALPGASHTIKGLLLGAELPDMNGEATGAMGMYTLTVGCDELAA